MIRFVSIHILLILLIVEISCSQTIANSLHNLSVSGTGMIRSTSESEICIFCHTPHNSNPRKPLWNRQDPGQVYTPYSSSTIQAAPGQPDGASILCLSCHDGTIALGNVLSRDQYIEMNSGITVMPDGKSNLGTNLSDDHPVSFTYDAALAAANGELADPATLTGPVQLRNDRIQCTACHDPHSDLYQKFLVADIQYSGLCLYCHQKTGWEATNHNLSSATWNGSGNNPWSHTSYNTVTENSCENCHRPHTAGGAERLTNHLAEEDNCLDCHNGNVASKDIQTDFNKTFRHDIYAYDQVHDPEENHTVDVRHVECVDCHNPHQSNPATASTPQASGFQTGVKGITSGGSSINEIQYTYELCYRCHAESIDKPGSPTSRQIEQDNVRLEFDLSNPSYHPIEGQGQNSDVPSLISPLTESSVIHCHDCHSSDNSSASGPHGSIYPAILKFRYDTDYGSTQSSYAAYELCFQCHDYDAITNNESNDFAENVHKKHIMDLDVPCNVCHDSHGISSDQGNSTNNSHLINFDLSVVGPSAGMNSRLEFIDNGNFAGQCYLQCHLVSRNHNPLSYQ